MTPPSPRRPARPASPEGTPAQPAPEAQAASSPRPKARAKQAAPKAAGSGARAGGRPAAARRTRAAAPAAPAAVPAAAKPARARKPKGAASKATPPAPAPTPPAPPTPAATPAQGLPPAPKPVGMPSEELLLRIVALVRERRGEDVVALDVRGLADYMDFLVVATGRSDRQNRAIADGVMRGLRGLKVRPLKRPGPEDGAWICLDFVDVVLHIFDGITRAHYDLENLWGDAPRFPLPEPPAPPTVG